MHTDSYVNGSIFVLLKKFVVSNYNPETWAALNQFDGINGPEYLMHQNYPLSWLNSMISNASSLTSLSETTIKEMFGEFLVPDLLTIYNKYIDPSWKTFEMLLYTEVVMHRAVRKDNSQATPPVLNVSKVNDKLLIIDYFSRRRLASLAVGIIRGIAKYYNESERINIIPVTNTNDERVQIRVEFN